MDLLTTDTVYRELLLRDANGDLVDADATPTGTLVANNADVGDSVTVTKISTGRYAISAALSSRTNGQQCRLRVTGQIGGVAFSEHTDTFRVGPSPADIKQINAVTVTGAGTQAQPWGP